MPICGIMATTEATFGSSLVKAEIWFALPRRSASSRPPHHRVTVHVGLGFRDNTAQNLCVKLPPIIHRAVRAPANVGREHAALRMTWNCTLVYSCVYYSITYFFAKHHQNTCRKKKYMHIHAFDLSKLNLVLCIFVVRKCQHLYNEILFHAK